MNTMTEDQKKAFRRWVRNHPDVWQCNGDTDHFWWVQNCLGDIFSEDNELSGLIVELYNQRSYSSNTPILKQFYDYIGDADRRPLIPIRYQKAFDMLLFMFGETPSYEIEWTSMDDEEKTRQLKKLVAIADK